MKIVHLCMCSIVTDGWNYQDNILPKFHKRLGYEVSLITSHFVYDNKGKITIDDRNEYINENGIKVIRLKSTSTKQGDKLKKFPDLFSIIEKETPDILFVHCPQFRDAKTVVKYIKKHPEVKLYVDNHADFSNSASNWLSKNILHGVWWKYYTRLLVPYATKFYGVLPARVNFLIEQYGVPKNKVELLVMGADNDYVASALEKDSINAIKTKLNLTSDDFIIVTGGKIDKAKKQTMLLMKAVKNLDKSNVKLIVFGSVEDALKEEFMSFVDGRKVKYIGWISAEDSYKYFACADLVCFPGRHSVFWEQVAGQGIPMLVKYWEGTQHVDLGGNVVFLHKDTVTEIQTEIEKLLTNNCKFQNMKNIAENEGMKYFSYQEIAKRSIEDNGL